MGFSSSHFNPIKRYDYIHPIGFFHFDNAELKRRYNDLKVQFEIGMTLKTKLNFGLSFMHDSYGGKSERLYEINGLPVFETSPPYEFVEVVDRLSFYEFGLSGYHSVNNFEFGLGVVYNIFDFAVAKDYLVNSDDRIPFTRMVTLYGGPFSFLQTISRNTSRLGIRLRLNYIYDFNRRFSVLGGISYQYLSDVLLNKFTSDFVPYGTINVYYFSVGINYKI